MKKKSIIHFITDAAVFAAIGFVLDFVQGEICNFLPFWPNGGSVGIAMCAVFVICYKYGIKGMFVGFIIGVLSMMNGMWISPLADGFVKVLFQLFLDYFGAWTVVGLAGVFANSISNADTNKRKIMLTCLSICFAVFARFLCHFLAGMLFWPVDDVTSQFIYSLTYNGSYMLPCAILCCIVMSLIVVKMPKLIKKDGKDGM